MPEEPARAKTSGSSMGRQWWATALRTGCMSTRFHGYGIPECQKLLPRLRVGKPRRRASFGCWSGLYLPGWSPAGQLSHRLHPRPNAVQPVWTTDSRRDWSHNSTTLGYTDAQFTELMHLCLTIHSDQEGGNVSAHTSRLVSSALSDPCLSLAAATNGLAGPRHGLANQSVLVRLTHLQKEAGKGVSDERLRDYIWNTLSSGRAVPGCGHAVLRRTVLWHDSTVWGGTGTGGTGTAHLEPSPRLPSGEAKSMSTGGLMRFVDSKDKTGDWGWGGLNTRSERAL
ncbi:hypothetical protein QTO34_013079 [Cnephaeus nilssonii]|uniref:Citrate synthase n=1 Tax=Cnephaeus nilssonii TaxID=3371016 RepID=A0AA40HAI8_CNENI|nr:hypothetical protein QTO34_013079 [Eptesicus nilssonii]